ncbi:MAG: DnaD domain protein [Bacilli bacterium]|nr:DnaD domain protein [Bacilli bacterium]
MNDKKEILMYKNFVINEYIVKNIKNFDISLNEFLLLLYFINFDNKLDIDNIKKYINFTNEEIISLYSSLTHKGIIETVINKKEKIIEETISLDPFYNKLLLSDDSPEIKTDIYSKFESEFGRTLSPIEYETINKWLSNNISEEMIINALKEAVLNGVTNLKYIDKIIFEWNKKKLNKKFKEEKNEELFDYDWLNED